MKKLLLSIAIVAVGFTANAQKGESKANGQTAKGKWLVEANTGFGGAADLSSNTSFHLTSTDDVTSWGLGAEAGYFVMDNLAVKAGLGYTDTGIDGSDGIFGYKIGAKYYVSGMIPLQIDLNGASANDVSPLFLGLQGGYAFFLGDMVSIEPGLRYNLDINDDADGLDTFQFNIGFALHF